MYKLVGVQGEGYAVFDDTDESIDILTKQQVCKCLNLSLEIGGVSQTSESDFTYSEEFFFSEPEEEDEPDDNILGDDYDFEDDSEDDDFEEDGGEDSEDDFEEDFEEDLNDDDFEEDDFEDSFSDDDYEDDDEDDSEDDDDFEDEEEDSDDDDFEDEDDYYDLDDFEYEDDGVHDSTLIDFYDLLREDTVHGDEKVSLIKQYYLWYSRHILTNAEDDNFYFTVQNNSRMKKKQEVLDNIRQASDTWVYAGCIDFGSEDEFCTLGHRLRYVHLAWDANKKELDDIYYMDSFDEKINEIINSDYCVKFGVKCITDFFQVSPECAIRLQHAQRDALKDMEILYNIYKEGTYVDEINASFGVADDIVSRIFLNDKFNSIMENKEIEENRLKGVHTLDNNEYIGGRGFAVFYKKFRKLGLIPPKSLMLELRDNIIGWTSHKYYISRLRRLKSPDFTVFRRNLIKIFGDEVDLLLRDTSEKFNGVPYSWVLVFIECLFMYEICGYYKYDGQTNTDEGGASNASRSCIGELYHRQKSRVSDAPHTTAFIDELVEFAVCYDKYKSKIKGNLTSSLQVQEDNGVFQVVKGDKHSTQYLEEYDSNLYNNKEKIEECFNEYSTYRRVETYEGFESLKEEVSSLIEYFESQETQEKISGYSDFVRSKLQEIADEGNKKAEEDAIRRQAEQKLREEEEKARKEQEEKARQERESKGVTEDGYTTKSNDEVLDYIKEHVDELNGVLKKELSFPLQVLDTVTKSNKYSESQFYYVSKIYTALTDEKVKDPRVNGKIYLRDDKELATQIKEIIADRSLIAGVGKDQKDTDKHYDILCSVDKFGSMSPKQKAYVDRAIAKYKENLTKK